jgi:biopolymer transport protein ExbD
MGTGTCEEIGFTDFSTTYFQYFTRLKPGLNSISSHVPDTLSARGGPMKRYWRTAVLGLVLLGTTIFRLVPHKHSQGLAVGIVIAHCEEDELLKPAVEDAHMKPIRVRVEDDGSFSINQCENVNADRLSQRLADIYQTRLKRTLFFDARDSVSYQQALDAIDAAQGAVPRLRVRLITATTRHSCETGGIIRRTYTVDDPLR